MLRDIVKLLRILDLESNLICKSRHPFLGAFNFGRNEVEYGKESFQNEF